MTVVLAGKRRTSSGKRVALTTTASSFWAWTGNGKAADTARQTAKRVGTPCMETPFGRRPRHLNKLTRAPRPVSGLASSGFSPPGARLPVKVTFTVAGCAPPRLPLRGQSRLCAVPQFPVGTATHLIPVSPAARGGAADTLQLTTGQLYKAAQHDQVSLAEAALIS